MKESLLNKGLTYFWQLFLVGGCVIISNLLFVFLLMTVKLSLETSVFYVISLLLFGPSLVPVLSVTRKMVSNQDDLRVVKDYFVYYKQSFKQNFMLWSIYIVALSILCLDLYYVSQVKPIPLLLPVFTLMLVIGLLSLWLSLSIKSYFFIKNVMAVKLSFYLAFKQPFLAMCIIFSMLTLYLFFMLFPQAAIFFGIPLFSLNLVWLTKKTFSKLALKYVE